MSVLIDKSTPEDGCCWWPCALSTPPSIRKVANLFTLDQSIFGNCVDGTFAGIPSIPQKNAEWMGHASLR
jgi:hypothetical protein